MEAENRVVEFNYEDEDENLVAVNLIPIDEEEDEPW